jgi:hypothetical protein
VLEILSVPLLGIIPESEAVLRASNLGTPVTICGGRSVMPCSSVCNGGPDNTLGRFRPSKMSHMSISASLPSAAPWRNLSCGLFLPLVFAGNVVMATLAWIIVGWITG